MKGFNMSITLDPREQTVKAFIRRKTLINILLYIAFFFIFLAIIVKRYPGTTIIGLGPDIEFALGLGIGIGLFIITFYLWRCPACRKSLGINFSPKACPHCKAEFTPYWKPDNQRRIFTVFNRKKKSRFLLYVLLFIALFFSVMTAGQSGTFSSGVMYFILGGIVLAFGIGEILFWRCPNCNSHLGRGWNPPTCPRCNTELHK
jgi:hypothetical protein